MTKPTAADLAQIGAKWLERIGAAEKRESQWIKDAEAAERAYLCDTSSNDMPEFNILHSNVETIVPSIYNSTPVPDIRPRHGNDDGAAKLAGDVLERVISTQIDDARLDAEIERSAQDAFMAGRGVVRVRFDADEDEAGGVTGERLLFEVVPWSAYREGPARRWQDVPWVAFCHFISKEEAERIEDAELAEAQADAAVENPDEDRVIWEIWDKVSRRVYFVDRDSQKVLSIKDDPLGLTGFFPMPEPVQPITGTSKRTPVCPYTVYKTLAEELDRQTRRINAIVKGLKVRGAIAADAGAIEAIAAADDNEIVSVGNLENLVAAGGLEKAIMWWPIDKAIVVLRELYAQREQTKASIYEITGISDIIRGQGNATETATAQQIKTQWGALRIKKMQRLIERQVRDIFVICAEIIARQFSIESMARMSGVQIDEQAAAILQAPLDHYRVNVESDSTVRADLTRGRQEMSEFLQGTATFFQTMAPLVQQAPEAAGPLVEMYASFARQFSLGKQAEDALEQFAEMARQTAQQPRPNPQAEAMQAEQAAKQADMQAKQAELQMKGQVEAAKIQLDREKLELERAKFGLDAQTRQAETQARGQEAAGQMAQGADVLNGMVAQALAPVIEEIRAGNMGLAELISQLGQAMGQGNASIVAAMTAPKRVIKDANGRPVGVETILN